MKYINILIRKIFVKNDLSNTLPVVDLRDKTDNPLVYIYYKISKVLLSIPIAKGYLYRSTR
jgi:hypothetical protein